MWTAVRLHWTGEVCGTRGLDPTQRRQFFDEISRNRDAVEPHIRPWAQFEQGRDLRLLEIGVGAGSDFVQWVRGGANAVGIDFTWEAVQMVRDRLALDSLSAPVFLGDATYLPFASGSFEQVYSYGVLHHTPGTDAAIREVHRVLRPGGRALIMVYHCPSWTGLFLWGLHALARGRPWISPRQVVYEHLESPGTKSYSHRQARILMANFEMVRLRTVLLPGDFLAMPPSAKYAGGLQRLLWAVFPRWLIRRIGRPLGTGLLIEAVKGHPTAPDQPD